MKKEKISIKDVSIKNYLKNGKFMFVLIIGIMAFFMFSLTFISTFTNSFDSIDWRNNIALSCGEKEEGCKLIDFSIIAMDIVKQPELEYYDEEKVVIKGPILSNGLDKTLHYDIMVNYKQLGELDFELKSYKSLSTDLEPGKETKVMDIDFDCDGKAWEIWYTISKYPKGSILPSSSIEKVYKFTVKPEDFKIQTHLPSWSKMNQPDFELREYDDKENIFDNEILNQIAKAFNFYDAEELMEYLGENVLILVFLGFVGVILTFIIVIFFSRFLLG